MQFLKAILIEFQGVLQHLRVVLRPLLYGIVVLRDSGHRKDRIAQPLKCFLLREIREHHLCPLDGRHSYDAPLPLVVHGVAHQVGHLCVVGDVGGVHLLSVHVRQSARFVGCDGDVAGSAVLLVFHSVVLPLRDLGEALHRLVVIGHFGDLGISPFHRDISRSRFVCLPDDLPDEIRVIDGSPHYDGLILLHVDAFSYHKPGQLVIHLLRYHFYASSLLFSFVCGYQMFLTICLCCP